MNTSEPRLLVTGTGGKLGSAIVRYLAAAGTSNVIAASRRPEALSVPSRFETRRVDFDDTASLVSAFAGVERALIISTDRIDAPGLRIEQQIAAVEAARAAGVRHLLYTSMPNPDRSLIPFAADHLETEKAIARSGAG
ncbi:MAG: NAD(P)H-binding protein, partial [Gammaproteobacteria bacterium]